MTTDDRKWCWVTHRESEEAWGPFETREEAIAGAVGAGSCGDCGDTAFLSRCNFPDPGAAAASIVDDLIDLIEERSSEEDTNGEGPTFAFVDGVTEDGLRMIVAQWLRANVKAVWFSVDLLAFEEIVLP